MLYGAVEIGVASLYEVSADGGTSWYNLGTDFVLASDGVYTLAIRLALTGVVQDTATITLYTGSDPGDTGGIP
jgi:hypothetical protein